MDSSKHVGSRRGLAVITCRPDGGQDSRASEVRARSRFGTTRTEARVAMPTNLQREASGRGSQPN